MNENELKKFAGLGDFLNNTDFAYQLGSTGKYALPAGALATLLGSYLNWSKAKDTQVEGETEDERRRRLWRSALVPATLGGLATLGTTAGLAALNTSSDPLSDKSMTGFSNLFKAGLKGKSVVEPKENNDWIVNRGLEGIRTGIRSGASKIRDVVTGTPSGSKIRYSSEPNWIGSTTRTIRDHVGAAGIPLLSAAIGGGTWGMPSVLRNPNITGGKATLMALADRFWKNVKEDVGGTFSNAWNKAQAVRYRRAIRKAQDKAVKKKLGLEYAKRVLALKGSKGKLLNPGTARRLGRAGWWAAVPAVGLGLADLVFGGD